MQDRVDRIHLRRRGAEAAADVLVNLVVAPEGKLDRDVLVARMERITASMRVRELCEVHREIGPDYLRMVGDALRKCGRTVTDEGVINITALVNGRLLGSLLIDTADPREAARAALVPVLDVLAPLNPMMDEAAPD